MSEKSKIKERIGLRTATLKRLYNQYFDNDGKESKVTLEPKDTEKRLALSYLADKGLINCRQIRGTEVFEFMVKITTTGIDFIENYILKEESGSIVDGC